MTGLFERVIEIGGLMLFTLVSLLLTVFHNGVIRNIYLGEDKKQRWYYWAYLGLFALVFFVALYPSTVMLYRTVIYKGGMWSKFSTTLLYISLLVFFGIHMWIMKQANDARVPPKDIPKGKSTLGDDGAPKQLDNTPSRGFYWFYVAVMGIVTVLGFRLVRIANQAHSLFNPGKGFQLYMPFVFVLLSEIYHLIVINDIYKEKIPPKDSQVGGKYIGYAVLSYITVAFVCIFVLQKGRWLRSVWDRMKREPKYNPIYDKDPTQPVNAQHMYIHQNKEPSETVYS